jgi:hypothetical protein
MKARLSPFWSSVLLACFIHTSAQGIILSPNVDAILRDGLGPAKDGSPDLVIDGGVALVQVVNVPNFEDRGIIEFGLPPVLSPATVRNARLILSVSASMGPYPLELNIYAYPADGSANLSDFDAGVHIRSVSYTGEATLILDVTDAVSNLAGRTAYIGFNFRLPLSPINLNGPFIAFGSGEFGSPAKLVINDEDADGVEDSEDECPGTPAGAIVNATGCSIDQLCPCSGPWRNHHEYVACVRETAADFVRDGLITRSAAREIIQAAQRSNCGR